MRGRLGVLAAAAAAAAGAAWTTAGAQTCLGLPSFASGLVQLSGAASVGKIGTTGNITGPRTFFEARTVSGGLSIGVWRGLFGGGAIGVTNYDDVDGSTTEYSANVGYEGTYGPWDTGRRISVCPYATGMWGSGPEEQTSGFDLKHRLLTAGLHVGAPLGFNPSVRAIPSVGFSYAAERFDPENNDNGDGFQPDDAEHGGFIDVALGIVFNDRIGVRPMLRVPIGLDNNKVGFGATVAINIGPPVRR